MAATLTTIDKLTKDVYVDGLHSWINKSRPLSARLAKITKKERFTGRQLLIGVQYGDNQATGAIAEDDVLPVGGNALYQQMSMAMKYYYGVARMTAQAMKAAENDTGGFAKSVTTELDSIRNTLAEDLAIDSVYGDGSGARGRVATTATGTTLTMRNQPTAGELGVRLLRRGMAVQTWAGKTGGSVGANHVAISALPTQSTATIASATFTAGEYVFRSTTASVDPRNKSMMGLGGIVDDGTRVGTFQGLSRTTYPELKANILGNSGVQRPWTQDLMDAACQESSINGGGKMPSAIYSPWEIQRRAAAYMKADRQFDMSVKTFDGGYAGLKWTYPGGSADWFVDKFCIPNEMQILYEADLFLAIQEDTHFDQTEGGSMWRYVGDRKHTAEAWLLTWRNMGAYACNNATALQDLSHTA